jgi:hypothetical protein
MTQTAKMMFFQTLDDNNFEEAMANLDDRLDRIFDDSDTYEDDEFVFEKKRWLPGKTELDDLLLSPADYCLESLVLYHLTHDVNVIPIIDHVINHHGANPDLGLATATKLTSLGNDKGLVSHFVTIHGADDWDVCLIGAARGNRVQWLEYCINKGAIEFETALNVAVVNESEDVIAFLINNDYVHFNEPVRDSLSRLAFRKLKCYSPDILDFLRDFHLQ